MDFWHAPPQVMTRSRKRKADMEEQRIVSILESMPTGHRYVLENLVMRHLDVDVGRGICRRWHDHIEMSRSEMKLKPVTQLLFCCHKRGQIDVELSYFSKKQLRRQRYKVKKSYANELDFLMAQTRMPLPWLYEGFNCDIDNYIGQYKSMIYTGLVQKRYVVDKVKDLLWRVMPEALIFNSMSTTMIDKVTESMPHWWLKRITKVHLRDCIILGAISAKSTSILSKTNASYVVFEMSQMFDTIFQKNPFALEMAEHIINNMPYVNELKIKCAIIENIDKLFPLLVEKTRRSKIGLALLEFTSSVRLESLQKFMDEAHFEPVVDLRFSDVFGSVREWSSFMADSRKVQVVRHDDVIEEKNNEELNAAEPMDSEQDGSAENVKVAEPEELAPLFEPGAPYINTALRIHKMMLRGQFLYRGTKFNLLLHKCEPYDPMLHDK